MSPATPWRLGRGWFEAEHRAYLATLAVRPASRAADHVPGMSRGAGPGSAWTEKRVHALLNREPPGPPLPDGPFARVAYAIRTYRFADPRITLGTFDPDAPLLGRDILVQARVLLVYLLVPLRIGAVLDETDATGSRFGIRMDTLAGHILDGAEWIEVAKDHQTGAVTATIAVRWRPSRLPTWWMALGFPILGPVIQARWRRQAIRRMRALGG